jgi:hypothetical protein
MITNSPDHGRRRSAQVVIALRRVRPFSEISYGAVRRSRQRASRTCAKPLTCAAAARYSQRPASVVISTIGKRHVKSRFLMKIEENIGMLAKVD